MSIKVIALKAYRSNIGQAIFKSLPDSIFIKIQYKFIMEKRLNLKNPKGFNEKLQWLKLHDRKPQYSIYADKYSVRNFIEKTIGEQYLTKLYGIWDNADDIDYKSLPEKFVIKGAHDSGSVVVCRNKNNLDLKTTTEKMRFALKKNNFDYGRDWPYKNITHRIIAEEYLDCGEEGLIDYKFYCFHGEPKFLYVSQGLENHETAHITFFDLDGKRTPFQRVDYPTHKIDPVFPGNFNEMIQITKVLAKKVDAPFIRVDLYNVNGRIVFSELTFRPCSGYMHFIPEEWDEKVGKYLNLTD